MEQRAVSLSDIPEMEGLAREFYALSGSPGDFSMDRFAAFWSSMIGAGTGAIFAIFDEEGAAQGAIGGIMFPDAYSGIPVATEFFWFVRPSHRGHGLGLYSQFEQWARLNGAVQIRMAYLCNVMPDGMRAVYEELGFDKIEVHYAKELK